VIDGYEAQIHQAVWKRPELWGAPRLWTNVWIGLCLYACLVTVNYFGFVALLVPMAGWGLGQIVLILLTLQDTRWDDIWCAQLAHRYRRFYEAG
jgi:hypothetical protein